MSPYFRPEDVQEFSDAELRQMSFIHAIAMNEVEDMKILVAQGVDLDAECSEYGRGNTLVRAVEEGSADAVAFLLSAGVRKDSAAIGAAAVRGDGALLELLLSAGVQPDANSVFGVSDPDLLERLIKAGAPINEPSLHGHWYAIHNAVVDDDKAVVELLLKAGANPNVTAADSWTPLMMAARGGDPGIVKLLLQFGADPSLTHSGGETALDVAQREGFMEAVSLITHEHSRIIHGKA